jgi:uncharacterized membrane protein YheB (UPF0754 family)
MSKNLLTNLIAALIAALSFVTEGMLSHLLLMTGLFALSGALTNWLAVHMLFERVPLLYGSGVILNRFEEFKLGIHGLMMNQFFTKANLERFFSSDPKAGAAIDLSPVLAQTDMSPAFDSLKGAVLESSFGTMLGMFGGANALDGLKAPFEQKLKSALIKIAGSAAFQKTLRENISGGHLSHDILVKVDAIVTARLEELTPVMVKEIVQKMIREHLGWLVVWGGVFGGLIGCVGAFLI